MTTDISLVQPKENLENLLGSTNSQLYWKTTRLWYKNQVSNFIFYKGSFTYYVITKGEGGGGFGMITLL